MMNRVSDIEPRDRLEARYRIALSNSGVIAFEQDAALRYTWLGQTQFYEMQHVIGRTDAELFASADAAQLIALKQKVIDTGAGVTSEVQVTMNGRRYVYVLSVEPIRDEGGNVVAITGTSRNITAWKETEEQLARALEFRDEMIAILGHDLRNPLGAISGGARLLLTRGGLSPEVEKTVHVMDRSARRMQEMIGTLLDFAASRFHDELPIARTPMDFAAVVRAVVSELEASNRGARIELVTTDDTRGIWDPARLAQVASNLVENALKHGQNGDGATVRVALRAEGDAIVLEVHNQGAPIPEELLPRLFHPFSRPSAKERDLRGGLGLGLYIAHQIVSGHGGTLTVESAAASGTTFRVRLPRSTPESQAIISNV